jgi:hypothetical protein
VELKVENRRKKPVDGSLSRNWSRDKGPSEMLASTGNSGAGISFVKPSVAQQLPYPAFDTLFSHVNAAACSSSRKPLRKGESDALVSFMHADIRVFSLLLSHFSAGAEPLRMRVHTTVADGLTVLLSTELFTEQRIYSIELQILCYYHTEMCYRVRRQYCEYGEEASEYRCVSDPKYLQSRIHSIIG